METTEKLKAKFSLSDAVEYDDAKPQIKQFMSTANGGIMLLALRDGQSIPQHLAPAAVMVTIIEGKVRFTLENDAVILDAGDSMLMQPGTPHSVDALADSKILLVKIFE